MIENNRNNSYSLNNFKNYWQLKIIFNILNYWLNKLVLIKLLVIILIIPPGKSYSSSWTDTCSVWRIRLIYKGNLF